MAPNQQLSIQLKRNKDIFIVSLKDSNSIKVGDIKRQLISILTSVGGISSSEEHGNGDIGEEDDIEIPKPSFGDDSDSDEDVKIDFKDVNGEEEGASGKIIPTEKELIIGKPVDKGDAFGDKFTEVADNEMLQLREFDVLGFKLVDLDEKFNVVQPNIDD